MPVTGLNRRCFLALLATSLPAAPFDRSTLDLLTDFASKLSGGNHPGALAAFAPTMEGYEGISANLGALTSQYDVICVIEVREESGDEARRTAETSWFLQLRSKSDGGPTERRNAIVRIATARSKGKWRITSLEPLSILIPPVVR